MHFLLGALLNLYAIFFFKSSSLLVSFSFLAFLLALVLANEMPRFKALPPTPPKAGRVSSWRRRASAKRPDVESGRASARTSRRTPSDPQLRNAVEWSLTVAASLPADLLTRVLFVEPLLEVLGSLHGHETPHPGMAEAAELGAGDLVLELGLS